MGRTSFGICADELWPTDVGPTASWSFRPWDKLSEMAGRGWLAAEARRLWDPQASQLEERLAAFQRDGPPQDRDGLAPGQRPTTFHLPGLRAQPWWHPHDESRDPAISAIVEEFRKAYPAVLSEVSRLQRTLETNWGQDKLPKKRLGLESLPVESGEWTQLCLVDEGRWIEGVCSHFPATTELLRRLPLCESSLGYAYLSRLAPGTCIAPHHGCTNVKLRAQLPLLLGPSDDDTDVACVPFSPMNCAARRLVVGDDWHEYFAGEPLIFDDSFCHSVSNMTKHTRVVLLVDLWHPDLTRSSISQLKRAFTPAPATGGTDGTGGAVDSAQEPSADHRPSYLVGSDVAKEDATTTLPDEVLELVLAALCGTTGDLTDLAHAAAACSRLAELARGESLWRKLYQRECGDYGGLPLAGVTGEGGTGGVGWRDRYREELHLRFDRPFPDPADIAAAAVAQGVASAAERRVAAAALTPTSPVGTAPPGPGGAAFTQAARAPPMKLLMVGDPGVGKSSFLMRFAEDVFTDSYIATIGVDFKIKNVTMRGKPLRLMIWDTAGPERFRAITSAYYRGAHGVFVMFDVADRTTFEPVASWVQQVLAHGNPDVRIMIVGLKAGEEEDIDSPRSLERARRARGSRAGPREVSAAEAVQLAQQLSQLHGVPILYFECSSKKGMRGVEHAIYMLAREVVRVDPSLAEPQRPRLDPLVTGPQGDPKGKCAIL